MKNATKKKLSRGWGFCLFTFPALIMVLFATDIPFFMNIYYSLFDWNGISRSMEFIGLQNFAAIFQDKQFGTAAVFTLQFALFYVVIVNLLAMLLALPLAKRNRFTNFSRAFFYLPNVISLVAIGLIWKFILTSGFNSLYEMTGFPIFGMSWMGTPNLAFWSILIISIWQNLGYYIVIYIAGVMAVPKDVLEAAEIDGAGPFHKFKNIILPLIMPSITICMLYSLTFAFKLFDIILVFTKGGPANSTVSVAYNIYIEAFTNNRYGLATAKSLLFFLAVLAITLIQLSLTKRREVES